ncbi:hypothetical protein [Thermocoleostomius sinensis]|uniref:Plastid lipid-associated protein/fibrillin conserved domain-containing protein n=1 Tax=Thermocoleostomius sinensis A174 TaxID=2016057 RepID=A0A9E8ZL13_9CYAN|nr:hypothetical protein [Thermocoleostomius sinensis]WAL60446.1 hypothetical protein OXH18_00180 [Thermocoleostomius sinensis A174]
MPSNLSPDLSSVASPADFLTTLAQAAHSLHHKTDRPSAPSVVAALLAAEKTAKQQRLSFPAAALLGRWQLWFTAPRNAHFKENVATGRGFYVPQIAPAEISFSSVDSSPECRFSQLAIGNQVQVGALRLKLTGPARYLGKKNLLAFDFTEWQLSAFGRPLYRREFRGGRTTAENFANQPIAKLPFFAFFLITEDFIAARGRGGGIALWVRQGEPTA